jgi:UDP-N-acetylmuramate--alanine ligase
LLEGRRLWLVGIGGAGMSSYALLSKAWGAEVGGWDRHKTPYLSDVVATGIEVRISPEPEAPAGWEVFVSSAFPFPGRSRAELLAELVSLRRSIVVAGAHGKSTTAAMIAFVLRELGEDPAWLIGAEVAQLGSNAGAGSGWLVVEGDESDRTIEQLHPEIAVITNVDLDHHSRFASLVEVQAVFDRLTAQAQHSVHGEELPLYVGELAVAGEHNRRNAAAALAALELAGIGRERAVTVLAGFRGAGRRLELRGEARGVAVFDDYAHNPEKVAAVIAAAREIRPDGRVLVLFQPHLYSRTRHSGRELAAALAGADAVAVAEIYEAREKPIDGVTGKLVVDALAELRPGFAVAWTPELEDGVRFLATRARAGDIALLAGAGDVDRAAPLLLEALR